MEIQGDIGGVLLLLTGLLCVYQVKKRRFNRTNAHGIQQFSRFEGKLLAKAGDAFLWLAAIATIAAGTVVLADRTETLGAIWCTGWPSSGFSSMCFWSGPSDC